MKTFILFFLILLALFLVTMLLYFLHFSLLFLIITVAFFSLTGFFFIYKNPRIQEKFPLHIHSSAFSSIAKKFLYPKLLLLTMVMPILASELGEVPTIYISGIVLAIIVLILLLCEIPRSPNIKKLFFWILLSLWVLWMNIDLFYMDF